MNMFIKLLLILTLLPGYIWAQQEESDFCRRLEPCGRILETEGYYVWGVLRYMDPMEKCMYFIPVGRRNTGWEGGFTNVRLPMR